MEIPFQSTSSAPAPNTTTSGSWADFLNAVVRGTTQIIQSVKSPTGQPVQGGWAGTSVPNIGQEQNNSSMLGLVVVAVLLFAIAKG